MNSPLYYRKNKNETLFQTLETSVFKLTNLQNYVPIYDNFFSLNATNYNSINLNQTYYFTSIIEEIDQNSLIGRLADNSDNTIERPIFCKFSPLLDPLKVLTGKYDVSMNDLIRLPQFNDNSCFPKLADRNNSAYVDSFFTYLSSQLLHTYNYVNAIDYYGSYLAIQQRFNYNIVDDIDYLNESDYFHKNKDIICSIENNDQSDIFNIDSRNNKKKLCVAEKINSLELDNLDDVFLEIQHVANTSGGGNIVIDLSDVCIYTHNIQKSSSVTSSSSCSSNSSNTTRTDSDINSDDDDSDNNDCNNDDNVTTSDSGTDADSLEVDTDNVMCSIFNFPVQMISMEKCENTLDYLMENELLNTDEWTACLFQVIITLSIYQKTFSFTHNDLHTNNIMYIPTEKQFIHYCFNGIFYKIPTYGKIYKIIDFGRAIYKFNGKTLCSDSFHPKGDAGSQYNCEPFFDDKKPRLEPNYSFDLARLACCLFDNFIDDIDNTKEIIKKNKLANLIHSWLLDDKQRNILYKTNGDERYPEFKLYKMIARTVHNAVPSKQLEHAIFKKYIIERKKINKNHKIINCDIIPNLC